MARPWQVLQVSNSFHVISQISLFWNKYSTNKTFSWQWYLVSFVMWFLKFQIILKIIPHTKHFRSWLPFCQSSMRTMVETQDSRRTQFVRMTGICKSLALFLLIYHCISDDIIFIFFTKDSTRILWTTPTGQPRLGRSIESSLLTQGGGRWSSPSLWYCQIAYCLHADSFFRYFGTKLSSRDSTMAPSCAPSSTLTIRWFCFSVHVLNS